MSSRQINTLDTFFSKYSLVSFTKGEIIYHPTQVINSIFSLQTGLVRMYVISADGEEITLHIFRPPAYFPLMLFLTNMPNTYYFEALEPITCIGSPAADVIHFLKQNPEATFDFATKLSYAISGLLIRIESLAGENAYSKVVHILLYLADKYGINDNKKIVISHNFSHEDIANWVGLRRETVSRQIELLQKSNLLFFDGKNFIILDIDKLELSICREKLI